MYEGVTCKKFFFYTVLKKEEGKQELSSAFKREGILNNYLIDKKFSWFNNVFYIML